METLAVELPGILGAVWNILCVALGLGLVIFFHELGHFAVAKWCDVHVERFSIGFGPILWSRQKGETEYALSAIPFGGYVKMLGQDDMDPGQTTDEDIAENPRAYSAKKVWQRMAIISAGVIMNVITAALFFTLAYGIGVFDAPPKVGIVVTGSPAWIEGIRLGDEITHINGEEMAAFSDISMEVALSEGDLRVAGRREDGSQFEVTISPDETGSIREIGILPIQNNRVIRPLKDDQEVTKPGLPASKADPPFLPGDTILSIGGEKTDSFAAIKRILCRRANEALDFELQRLNEDDTPGETVVTTVEPMNFRSLGIYMEIGPVAALQDGSPAAVAGLRAGDTIKTVNQRAVGTDLDPLQLPDYLAQLARESESVEMVVRRQVEGAGDSDVVLQMPIVNRPGWQQMPLSLAEPFPVPAIGAAYMVTTRVAFVRTGSQASEAGVTVGQRVVKLELVRTDDGREDSLASKNEVVDLDPQDEEPRKPVNWAAAFSAIQEAPFRKVVLHLTSGDDTTASTIATWDPEPEMFLPIRGFITERLLTEQKADGIGHAFSMGLSRTRKTLLQIYLTLKALLTGRISPKELHGPVGIAQVGYKVAEQGISELLIFLGFLSVNLAVLNFLPIPILDGGHMVFLTYEAVAGKKPSDRVYVVAQYIGLAFILGLMLFVLGQDFLRILGYRN